MHFITASPFRYFLTPAGMFVLLIFSSAYNYDEEYAMFRVCRSVCDRYCVHTSNATASCCGLSINHSRQDSCKVNDFMVYSIFHEICTRLSCALSYCGCIISFVCHLSIFFTLLCRRWCNKMILQCHRNNSEGPVIVKILGSITIRNRSDDTFVSDQDRLCYQESMKLKGQSVHLVASRSIIRDNPHAKLMS